MKVTEASRRRGGELLPAGEESRVACVAEYMRWKHD